MPRSLVALVAVLLAGCGYIGDPLPPLANVPLRVNDLAVVQHGAQLVVQFTVPAKTTEDHPIPAPLKLDLRAGSAEQFEEHEWADHARQIPTGPVTSQIAYYEIPSAEWTGKEVIFGVRIVGGNGKESAWSNFVVVPVLPPAAQPAGVSAIAVSGGVRLTWSAPGAEFRVLRKVGDGEYSLVATVPAREWLDTTAEFGQSYSYKVQTIARHDKNVAESEFSKPVSITPADTFPPAAPAGLRASTAPNSIELNWEPNSEPDLNGYRIYRAAAASTFEKIAEVSAVPSYSDHAVEPGKTYRYAITALDRTGNESPRSPIVEVVLP